jgi:hypothetical protein
MGGIHWQVFHSLQRKEYQKLVPWKGRSLNALLSSLRRQERDLIIANVGITRHSQRREGNEAGGPGHFVADIGITLKRDIAPYFHKRALDRDGYRRLSGSSTYIVRHVRIRLTLTSHYLAKYHKRLLEDIFSKAM